MENIIEPLEINIRMEEPKLTPAERFYRNHLKNVSNYQKRNGEKMREKNKAYAKKVKEDKPEKYKEMLERKKQYYLTVIKLKKEKTN
jgi:hypothetical protein